MIAVETHADDALGAVRRTLEGADAALVCVSAVQRRGVHLLSSALGAIDQVRLVTTTVFGTTTRNGLAAAADLGADVRVLNPARGAFHAKLYLARRGDEFAAAIGSANLTSGLIANVESMAVLRGPELEELWRQAEAWWSRPDAQASDAVPAPAETLHPRLLRRIEAGLDRSRSLTGQAVTGIAPDGVRAGDALLEAWTIELAWDWLQARGALSEEEVAGLSIAHPELLFALLGTLPGVREADGRVMLVDDERARLTAVH